MLSCYINTFSAGLVMLRILFLLTIIIVVASLPIISNQFLTQDKKSLDKESIEQIVDNYINNNPDKILDAIDRFHRDSSKNELSSFYKDELSDFSYPTAGNKDSKIIAVEFFDYTCRYCKLIKDDIKQLIADNTVRYVFRDLPILGNDSLRAARAALAVHFISSDKYVDFYNAALSYNGSFTESAIFEIIKSIGISEDDFNNALNQNSDKIDAMIAKSKRLAEDLHIGGTPAIIIGDSLFIGATDLATLRNKVNEL